MTADGNFHLLRNSAWNASAFLVNVGLNLLILPFVLHQLGAAMFGVAGLVTVGLAMFVAAVLVTPCIAPALTFCNAFCLANTRDLAQRLAPSRRQDARRTF